MTQFPTIADVDIAADFKAYRREVCRGGDVAGWLTEKKRHIKAWGAAAAVDDAKAQMLYGECLSLGVGVKADPDEAFVLFQRAADMGLPDALYILGECYIDGAGCPKDRKKAFDCH